MNNKKFTDVELIKRLARAGRDFKFSVSDKNEIKINLMTVIKSDPKRIQEQSHISNIFNPRRTTMQFIPIIMAAIIAIGGGTAVLADYAKPGDALYPMDQWVERMQEKMTFQEKSKAGLYARFSEERAEEMKALYELDPQSFTEKKLAMWEEHKQEALGRLAISIERAELIRNKFESKLGTAENASQAKAFEIVINRIDEIVTRRELKIEDFENWRKNRGQGPSTGQKEIREMIREFMGDNNEIIKGIHREVAKDFGGDFLPIIAPPFYPVDPINQIQLPEKWLELQREMAKRRAEVARQLAKDMAEGKIEIINPDPINPAPEPMELDDDSDEDENEDEDDDSLSSLF